MEFQIERCYTVLNADELKAGSKVIVANAIKDLKRKVAENEITELKGVKDDCYERRFIAWFDVDLLVNYALAYLVSEPEEKKLKWTDLEIGDVIRPKYQPVIEYMVSAVHKEGAKGAVLIATGEWLSDERLEEWEKVEC